MRRWKWLWILPVLAGLGVGLGCTDEKPLALSQDEQEDVVELVAVKVTGPPVCVIMIARDEAEPALESKAACGCFMMNGSLVVAIHDILCPTSNAEAERFLLAEAELELVKPTTASPCKLGVQEQDSSP